VASLEVVPIGTGRELDRFIRLPFRIYREDPIWVAPLPSDERVRLTPGKNPYFEHAEAAYFMAREGGRDVGRISASVDQIYDRIHHERQATFGFFEAESAEATRALLGAAEGWARSKGAEIVRGPMSFNTNDEVGLLIEGFEHHPSILMTYNKREYAGWIESAGYTKAKDLLSHHLVLPRETPEAYRRVAEKVRRRYNVTIRSMDMKHFDEELERVKEVYNSAWLENWGFVPMTDREIDHMAKQLKPAVNPNLVIFAEVGTQTVAFALAMPDVNIALKPIRGRLFPFGILRLLWTLPRIHHSRLMAIGIRKEYRRRGIDALLMEALVRAGNENGIRSGELSWTLEDNYLILRNIEQMGGVRQKVYRIYERRL